MTEPVAVSVTGRRAPVALLGRLGYSAGELPSALAALRRQTGARHAVLLSTCQRVEVYAAGTSAEQVLDFLGADRGVDPGGLRTAATVLRGDDVTRHLFGVICGLESMVFAETEVIGQVRAAGQAARAAGCLGGDLDALFRAAAAVVRRARREAGLDGAHRSVGRAAVDLLAAELGGLAGRDALVVGAGRIAAATAGRAAELGARIVVCNRTPERAERLAARLPGADASTVPFSALEVALRRADLALVCTGAPHAVLTAGLLRRVVTPRRSMLPVVDLAVPPNVDPAARVVPGVRLVNLDDLRVAGVDAADHLCAPARLVQQLVAEEAAAFAARRRARDADRLVRRLRERGRAACATELARTGAGLPPEERAVLGRSLERAVNTVLHAPTVALARAAAAGDRATLAALATAYGLD